MESRRLFSCLPVNSDEFKFHKFHGIMFVSCIHLQSMGRHDTEAYLVAMHTQLHAQFFNTLPMQYSLTCNGKNGIPPSFIPNQLTIIIHNVDCSINLQSRRPNFTHLQSQLTRWKGDDNFKGFHALYYFIVDDSDIDTTPSLIASQE